MGPELYRQTLDPYMGIVMAHERLVYPYLQDNYEELRSACEGADLLVANNWLPIAPITAEKAGLKWLAVFLQPLGLHSRFDPPVLPILPLQARFGPKARWVSALTLGLAKRRSAEFTRPLEQFRERLGLPPSKRHLVFETYSPYGNMGWFSRVIGSWRPDWPARTKVTGFVDAPGGTMADDPGLEAFLGTGSAPVVFALGSFAVLNPENFFAESAAIARKLKIRAVLVSADKRLAEPGIYVSGYVPYARLFPRASLIVHQAGIGTLATALKAGRPMICVPFAQDQPDNAHRAARLGVARVVPRAAYRADVVAPILEKMLTDPAIAAKSSALARKVNQEDGIANACRFIENFLA